MLRIVNQHYSNLQAMLAHGDFGKTAEDHSRVTLGGGFYGVPTKMIRNMYILSSKLIDHGEIVLTWAFDEPVFRHFLSMLGLSNVDVLAYKYVGDSDRLQTRATLSVGNPHGSFIEVTVKVFNDLLDEEKKIISSSSPIVGVQRLNVSRRRFDLMIDNPLHVAYGMIEARKKAEKVVVSFNSPAYPSRARESQALHRAAIELFSVVSFYQSSTGTTDRHILGKGHSLEAKYGTHSALIDALDGSTPVPTTFVFDFTDVEEFTCLSVLRNNAHHNYSLFPMGRLRPSMYYDDQPNQRYELSARVSTNMLKAIRAKTSERLRDPQAVVHIDSDPVVMIESLRDVMEVEKDFYLPDTAISIKEVVGSLRDYYTKVGGVAIALIRSKTSTITGRKRVRSFSLVDMRNGVEVIRCDATEAGIKVTDGVYEIEPITLFEPMAYNAVDTKIFHDNINGLLSKGHTVVIRKSDGSKFSLHPKLFEQLQYVGDRFEPMDDRIRAQMMACFMDITEVELKPKLGDEVRGYKFIAEPQR